MLVLLRHFQIESYTYMLGLIFFIKFNVFPAMFVQGDHSLCCTMFIGLHRDPSVEISMVVLYQKRLIIILFNFW